MAAFAQFPSMTDGMRCDLIVRQIRVCIVTTGHLATNPRAVKEACTLRRAGYDITLVHGDYIPAARAIDSRIAAALRCNRFPVPFGPAQPSRLNYIAQSFRRKAARLTRRALPIGDAAILSAYSPLGPELRRAAQSVPAHFYIAHYVAALPAVASAAKMWRTGYAFDAEDFHTGDLPDDDRHDFDRDLTRAIEQKHLPNAAYVSAASPGIAEAYASEYQIDMPTVLLNTFPKNEAPPASTARGNTLPGPTLYWFSQTIGPDRGLECAIAAIASARSVPHLHLRGTCADGYRKSIMGLASTLGVDDRVHIHAAADPDEMVRLAVQYDAGLVAETGATANHRIMLSNKQFTYLLAGIPALLSDIPSHIRFAKDADGGAFLYRTEDPVSLAAALDALFADPARLARARARAYELAQTRFNWECEAPRLLACVESALAAVT
jgi:glycosyltransferase involved in cell wall biosynthesis